MAYGKWEYVINEYANTFLKLTYSEHARAFTRLIPQLKNAVSPDLTPGVTLGNLFLEHPDKSSCIRIDFVKPGKFNIYRELYLDRSRTFETECSEADVISVVQSLQSGENPGT